MVLIQGLLELVPRATPLELVHKADPLLVPRASGCEPLEAVLLGL